MRQANPTPWELVGQTIRDANGDVVVSAINPCDMETRKMIVAAVNAWKERKPTDNKLREVLGKLRAALWNNTVIAGKRKFELYEIADAALAAPPRNCDVGTAEEQAERYMNFCHNYPKCTGCPCVGQMKYKQCEFAWSQLPYEDGETGGGSHGSRNGERKAQLAGVAREAVCR